MRWRTAWPACYISPAPSPSLKCGVLHAGPLRKPSMSTPISVSPPAEIGLAELGPAGRIAAHRLRQQIIVVASMYVGYAMFLALMAKSAGWPSMARIIINWFKPDQYGRVWGILSTSSRVGTLAATFCLGSLLAYMSWRGMLWIAAGLGIVTAIAFAFLLKEHPQ